MVIADKGVCGVRWNRWQVLSTVAGFVIVVGVAVFFWNKAPSLYPEVTSPADRPDVAAAREATRTQAIVTTRASVLAALAGVGALVTIAINLANSRIQAATLTATAASYAAAEADRSRDIDQRDRQAREDREQRDLAAQEAAADARERRVTEIYTAAADQLGSSKAAVRLAGLYALERLAESNPDQRPTVVRLFCAYLRMPYPHGPTEGGDGDGPGSTWLREEREVRLACQRTLAMHLRPEELSQPAGGAFWGDLEVDLAGAVLIDLDFQDCRLIKASFRDATLRGRAYFDRATFVRGCDFRRVQITQLTRFANASFEGGANFEGVHFQGSVKFVGAQFRRGPSFARAVFEGSARFENATFERAPNFGGARARADRDHRWPAGVQLGQDAGTADEFAAEQQADADSDAARGTEDLVYGRIHYRFLTARRQAGTV